MSWNSDEYVPEIAQQAQQEQRVVESRRNNPLRNMRNYSIANPTGRLFTKNGKELPEDTTNIIHRYVLGNKYSIANPTGRYRTPEEIMLYLKLKKDLPITSNIMTRRIESAVERSKFLSNQHKRQREHEKRMINLQKKKGDVSDSNNNIPMVNINGLGGGAKLKYKKTRKNKKSKRRNN